MITDAEEFFARGCGRCARFDTEDCSVRRWREGLAKLRALCLEAGLEEGAKWGHPCYMHGGRNLAILGGFRGNFRLTFFDAELLDDPEGLLERRSENTRAPDMLCFTDVAQVSAMAPAIRGFLAQGKAMAEQGVRPERTPRELEMPEELAEALDADPELAEAFHALTPGRQRSYVFNLQGAKRAETRRNRIAKFRDRIFAGKGANER